MSKHFSIVAIVTFLISHNLIAQVNEGLTGTWGMFNDKHPDGWGNFDPPYFYLVLNEDMTFKKVFIHRKSRSMVFGTYEVTTDSLIVFHESTATDGMNVGVITSDTSRVVGFQNEILELHEHWYSLLRKRKKEWRHRKKFRMLTPEEHVNLSTTISTILKQYSLIKN